MSGDTGKRSESAVGATTEALLREARKQRFLNYWRPRRASDDTPLQKIRNLNKIGARTRIKDIGISLTNYRYLHARYVRGLIIYQKYDKQDLQTFCKSRGIPFGNGGSEDRIVHILQKADSSWKFEKFIDLPAELRTLVYEEYLGWLPTIQPHGELLDHTLPPPPITQTCRLLRKETLPEFEDRRTIALIAMYDHNILGRSFRERSLFGYIDSPVVTGDLFTSIKNIRLDLTYSHYKDSAGPDEELEKACAYFLITLSKDRKQAEVKMPELHSLKKMMIDQPSRHVEEDEGEAAGDD